MSKKKRRDDVHVYMSDDAYKAFKTGRVVSNNGFRKPNGQYNPDQPELRFESHQPSVPGMARDYAIEALKIMTWDASVWLMNRVEAYILKALEDRKVTPNNVVRIKDFQKGPNKKELKVHEMR